MSPIKPMFLLESNVSLRFLGAALTLLLSLSLSCAAGRSMEQESPSTPAQSMPDIPEEAGSVQEAYEHEEPASTDDSMPPPSAPRDSAGGSGMKKSPSRVEEIGVERSKPAAATAASTEEGGFFEGDTYDGPTDRDEIEELEADIRKQVSSQRSAVADYDARAPRTCNDVCDLSEAICASSTKICKIADSHPSEPYFDSRCRWSRKECRTADSHCSQCSS